MRRAWCDLADLSQLLKGMLEEIHPGDVRKLSLRLTGDTLTISGEVGSERSRSAAKRFALSFNGVFKVRNELDVVGYLAPATDDGLDSFFGDVEVPKRRASTRKRDLDRSINRRDTPTAVSDPAAGPVEVVRQPSVSRTGELSAGNWVDLIVDLASNPVEGSPRIVVGRFPHDWAEIEVSVQLFANWASRVEVVEPVVVLLPDGPSRPAAFRCLVAADHVKGSPANVLVSFAHGVRQCGSLNVDVGGETVIEPIKAEAPTSFATSVAIGPDTIGPTLSISIFSSGSGRQVWMWRALVPGGTQESNQEIELSGDEASFADALLRDIPGLASDRHRRVMRGMGERLWQRAPPEFRTAFLSWRTLLPESFPIQFVTDDPHVPWEMMKPDVDGADHLFLEHPVARWPMQRSKPRRQMLPDGELLSFVPQYGTGDGLEGARLEGEWIVQSCGGKAMPGTREALFDVLDGQRPGPIAVLHFAGHGSVHSGVTEGGLEMEDGLLGVGEVDQTGTGLGKRDGTLVMLNACETGAVARLLGMNTGWGAALAAQGFSGLIAPLWEVQDGAAFGMAKSMLPPILTGSGRLGEALRDARRTHADSSIAAFAYLAHGDVMAIRAIPR